MPKFFSYEVSTVEVDYTRYYAHFKVIDTDLSPGVVYVWNFGQVQPNPSGVSVVYEYQPGEYLVSLFKATGANPAVLVETSTIFVVAMPHSKLANGQLQPISIVDLFTTVGLKQSITLPTKMLEVGDSYAQNKSDYINEFDEMWNITTGLLTQVQKDRLEATFQQLAGVAPFNFVPSPSESAVPVVCESWKPTQLSNSDYQFSIQAKRFFTRPKISFNRCGLYKVKTIVTTLFIPFNSACPGNPLARQTVYYEGEVRGRPSTIKIAGKVGCDSLGGGFSNANITTSKLDINGKGVDCVTDVLYQIPATTIDPDPPISSDITANNNHYTSDARILSIEFVSD